MSLRGLAAVVALLVCAVLFALPSSPLSAAEDGAKCSGQSAEPLVKLLPPPPCETCEETKAELAELADLEHARTPEQESSALNDAKGTLARFIEGAGIAADVKALEACEGFFVKRRQEEVAAVEAAKSAFCRLRPFKTLGSGLHPVQGAKPEDSFSYPSGHAAWGGEIGLLLIRMMPEKQSELYQRINGYARSRMIAGVHFRSDVEAGKLFGAALANALFASPDFNREFDEAKTCVRKAVGLH
jgi:acid phosphatase (class A)